MEGPVKGESENIVLVLSTVPNGTCTEEKTLHLLQIVVLLWNWSWRIRPGERWQPKCNRRMVPKPMPAKPLERPAINGGRTHRKRAAAPRRATPCGITQLDDVRQLRPSAPHNN